MERNIFQLRVEKRFLYGPLSGMFYSSLRMKRITEAEDGAAGIGRHVPET